MEDFVYGVFKRFCSYDTSLYCEPSGLLDLFYDKDAAIHRLNIACKVVYDNIIGLDYHAERTEYTPFEGAACGHSELIGHSKINVLNDRTPRSSIMRIHI